MDQDEINNIGRQVASDYVVRSKRWAIKDFTTEVKRTTEEGLIVINVVHVDDLKGLKGSNKSVQLYIDAARKVVVKELGFQ